MPPCHVSCFTVWWLCHNYYFPLRDMNFWMQDLVIVKYHETCKLNVCSLLGHALVLASFCDHPVEYVNWVLDETNRWIKQVMLQNVLQVCSLYSTMLLDAFILHLGADFISNYYLYLYILNHTNIILFLCLRWSDFCITWSSKLQVQVEGICVSLPISVTALKISTLCSIWDYTKRWSLMLYVATDTCSWGSHVSLVAPLLVGFF